MGSRVARQAVASIWDVGLVNNCTIGTSRSYSTPAFTFAGAVLEQATGRTLKQLLRNELTKPYSLGMRIQFTGASLPKNYERAVPYTNNNDPTSYSDNSWKVFGGGLETSAYQLARFGWKVLDAQILSVNARDNRLWTQVNPNQRNGLGWIIRTRSGRRVAEHDGSWTGTRTYLRVFRDDGLVVAVMSNRRGHTVDDVSVLTADLANIVLN